MEGARLKERFLELLEFGSQLAVGSDAQTVFQRAAEGACRLSRARACSIWTFSGGRARPLLRAWHSTLPVGPPPSCAQRRLRRVLREGKPVFLSRRQTCRTRLHEHTGEGRAALLPLRRGENIWGIMAIAGGDEEDFTAEEIWWLGLIAGEVELGLQVEGLSRGQEQLREQINEVMSRLGNAVSSCREPKEFLRLLADIALRLSLADRGFVWLVKEGQPKRLCSASRTPGRPLAIGRESSLCLVEKCLQEQAPCGWREEGSWPAGSALAIPLRVRDDTLGVISLYWADAGAYGDAERDLLVSFAGQVEIALENLLLRQAEEKSLSQLAELSGVVSRMASCPDSLALVKATVRATSAALRCPILGIALLEESGYLSLAANAQVGLTEAAARNFRFLADKESLAHRVLVSRETAALSAIQQEKVDPLARLLETRSIACAPLLGAEGPVGILLAAHPGHYTFQPAELSLLSAYASQAALALRNATLCENLTKHLDRLAAFSEYAGILASSLDMEKTLKAVVDSTSRLLETDVACLLLKEAASGSLKICATHALSKKGLSWPVREGMQQDRGLAALALEQDKLLSSKDLARDGRYKHRHLARQAGPVSAMVAPVKTKGKPLGALCVCTGKARDFTEHDKRLLSMLADGAGIEIENARLYQEQKERASFLSSLVREANHRIRNSLQTIAGLLEMELAASDRAPQEALRKSIERIQCIGAVHALLSEENLHQVEMKETARRIGEIVRQSAGRPAEEISLQVCGARVLLDSQKAAALSLAISELADNTLQHGLRSRPHGKVLISFAQSDREITVAVSDDGVGLPQDFSLSQHSRLGLKIASGVAAQDLGGEFRLFSKGAATIAQIRFPR